MTIIEPLLHEWINRNYPRVGCCEHCGRTDRPTEYASIEHVYTRDRADWCELCRSCHRKMDGVNPRARGPEIEGRRLAALRAAKVKQRQAHGMAAYTKRGCRCDVCKAAKRESRIPAAMRLVA